MRLEYVAVDPIGMRRIIMARVILLRFFIVEVLAIFHYYAGIFGSKILAIRCLLILARTAPPHLPLLHHELLGSDLLKLVHGFGRVQFEARWETFTSVNQFLVEFVILVGQVRLVHIVFHDHLHEVAQGLLHGLLYLCLRCGRILDKLIKLLCEILHLAAKGFSVHVLPEELHHTFEAVGDEGAVISLLD